MYKLVATTKEDGEIVPKIKISENTDKITNPGYKKVYRLFDKETNKAIADLIASYDEIINPLEDITIYHQSNIWKNKTIEAGTYEYEELQVPIFKDGQLVYPLPTINEIRQYAAMQAEKMWDEIFRLEYPHIYYVDLTKKLLDQKIELLEKNKYKGKK